MKLQLSATMLLVYSSLLLLFGAVTNADQLSCSFSDDFDVKGDGSLLMRQFVNQNDQTVTVQLEYAGIGWLGFAFTAKPIMLPNTAVIGLPDAATVQKYDLQGRVVTQIVPLQERQTLTNATIEQVDGKTTLTFTKPLVEDTELAVAAGPTLFNYAIGGSNQLAYHLTRGSATVTLTECLAVGTTAAPAQPTTSPPSSAPTKAPTAGAGGIVNLGNGRIQRSLALENGQVQAVLTTDQTAGTLTVDMVRAGQGWVGFAFSLDKLMPDSVAVIAYPDDGLGQPRKWDLASRTNAGVTMAPDTRQTLTNATYFQNDTHTGMTFTKLLVEDGDPPVSLTQSNFFLYALGRDNAFGQHATRNSFALNFADTSGSAIQTTGSSGPPNKSLWITHGIMMAIAWAILVPIAIGTSILRSLLPLRPVGLWFQIHRGLNMLGVSLTIAGFSIAVHLINKEQGASAVHFKTLQHHKVGLVVFVFACYQAINGIFRPNLPHKPEPAKEVTEKGDEEVANEEDDTNGNKDGQFADKKDDQPPKKALIRVIWEYVHRIFGTITLGLAWYNCSTGITAFNNKFGGPNQSGALWGVIGGISGTVLILAIYQKVRKQ
jgi:DOMON domain